MSIDQVKAVADAVLYEGYLLYPYRASSRKNQSRWQFGVLGPPNAVAGAFAEEHRMEMQCLLEPDPASPAPASVVVRLRFLHLQVRSVERRDGETYRPVSGAPGRRHAAVELGGGGRGGARAGAASSLGDAAAPVDDRDRGPVR